MTTNKAGRTEVGELTRLVKYRAKMLDRMKQRHRAKEYEYETRTMALQVELDRKLEAEAQKPAPPHYEGHVFLSGEGNA